MTDELYGYLYVGRILTTSLDQTMEKIFIPEIENRAEVTGWIWDREKGPYIFIAQYLEGNRENIEMIINTSKQQWNFISFHEFMKKPIERRSY